VEVNSKASHVETEKSLSIVNKLLSTRLLQPMTVKLKDLGMPMIKIHECVNVIENCFDEKDIPTSGLAVKTSSNCFTTSGGEIGSISAPSIEMGTLTAESSSSNKSICE
jgi:hypothetical protein